MVISLAVDGIGFLITSREVILAVITWNFRVRFPLLLPKLVIKKCKNLAATNYQIFCTLLFSNYSTQWGSDFSTDSRFA